MNQKVFESYPNPDVPLAVVSFDSNGVWGDLAVENRSLLKLFETKKLAYKRDAEHSEYRLYALYEKGWYQVCRFWIDRFPGCCGMVLVHDFMVSTFWNHAVEDKYQDTLNTMIQFYEKAARDLGYTTIMATELDETGNDQWAAREYNCYTKAGWKPLKDFVNKRTSKKVIILCKEL